MNKYIYLLYVAFLFLTCCKTITSVTQESQNKTVEPLVLGSIGSGKEFILQKEFNNTSYPTLLKPIKVSALKTPFTTSTYKSFLKSNKLQSISLNIKYIDSLEEKPFYVKLQIADVVSVVDALNDVSNSNVKSYLSINDNANLITDLSIALNTEHLKKVEQAKSIFLIEHTPKTYALQLHLDNNIKEVLYFNDGVIFGYKTANCCWQENKRHHLDIVDLVSTYTNCPNKTYRVAKKASKSKKKVNYFKL